MRVQCPHCKALCEIEENVGRGDIKCGKCAKVFVAPELTEPEVPLESATAPAAAPQQQRVSKVPRFGSLFSGVQNIYQKIGNTIKEKVAPKEAAAAGASAATTSKPESESDLNLDLDGPVADRLEELAKEEQRDAPVLGSDPESLHGAFRLDIGASTSVGRVRPRNEDSFVVQHLAWSNRDVRREVALLVVADGMGGHDDGDLASKITIQTIGSSLTPVLSAFLKAEPSAPRPPSYRAPIEAAIKAANAAVHQQSQAKPESKGMGATGAVVFIADGKVDIGHVGDCRVYHYHDGNLTQVTRDQTLVERMVELGQLTREEAESQAMRNEVTQAIGFHQEIQPAFHQLVLAPGDWLVVACDGLHAHVNYRMLSEALQAAPFSAGLLAHYLVDLANHHGGSDNCTVVAVHCF